MNKELIERMALEVAAAPNSFCYGNSIRDVMADAVIVEFATRFLEAYLAKHGKEAVGYLPEASPLTKGVCNDERSCSACFSGQGKCELAPQPAIPEGMALVTKEDANNYCRILSVLGMEEEGDPISKIETLIAAAGVAP